MEDDRIDETEPWSPQDRKRFWSAITFTLILFLAALYGIVWLAFHAWRIPLPS